MQYRCVKCHKSFSLPTERDGNLVCERCSFTYQYDKNYLKYEYDSILFEAFKKKYVLNKVLNLNGYLSYIFLPEASLSLTERDDVKNFRDYIESYLSSGMLLDIGCGILPLPGYLDFKDRSQFEFYGLDPIDDKSFSGMRIVGCAEFMPFDDAQFDGIVFATSLDHVCSIEKTIDECYRTLTIGGRILIWMSDRSRPSFLVRIKQWLNQRKYNWKKGYRADKFVVFPNWTVLHVPDGAVDPFHSFNEAPKEIISLMKAQGFKHDDIAYNNPNEIFLCFSKVSETSD